MEKCKQFKKNYINESPGDFVVGSERFLVKNLHVYGVDSLRNVTATRWATIQNALVHATLILSGSNQ